MNEAVKVKLLAEQSRLEEELRSYKAEDPFLAQNRDMEIKSIDNDSLENESHDRIQATRNSITEDLSGVLLALAKVDQGTYGQCEKCGQLIEEGRLQASPTARFCMADAG